MYSRSLFHCHNYTCRFLVNLLSLLTEGCHGPELEQLINGGALSSCLTLLKQIGGETVQNASLICTGIKCKCELTRTISNLSIELLFNYIFITVSIL